MLWCHEVLFLQDYKHEFIIWVGEVGIIVAPGPVEYGKGKGNPKLLSPFHIHIL